ncbi:hybrid sensor histidine kinase/response regulator [Undibacterium sp. Di26W]|uniref:hybrid sensor histidine kinase/response regulator n=1 Tax=Undibacterium sp. Di26W TaxID=3413035 RepID=UPI003BF1FB30
MEQLETHSTDFSHVVLGALDEVFKVMETEATHSANVADVTKALSCYIEQLRRIRVAASAADMPGLHWVCALIERNLINLHNQTRLLSDEEYFLLSEWPDLLASHALNHGDRNIETLIAHLSTASWPMPLNQVDSCELRQLLCSDPLTFDEEMDEPPPLFLVASDELLMDASLEGASYTTASYNIPLAAIDNEQNFSLAEAAQQSAHINAPSDPLSALHDAMDALIISLVADEHFGQGGEHDALTLQSYAAQLQVFSSCASAQTMEAIADACHAFAGVVTQRSTVARPVNETELGLLNRFPLMLMDGIADPSNPDLTARLLDVIYDAAWMAEPESAEPEADRPQAIVEIQVQAAAAAGVDTPAPATVQVTALKQEISSDMLALFAKEFSLMAAMLTEDLNAVQVLDAPSVETVQALQNYSDALLRIGATAESVGLTALQQVLTILAQQVSALNEKTNAHQHALLATLPARLLAYLDHPAEEVPALELMELVIDPSWPVDAAQWDDGLFARLIDVKVLAESVQEDSVPSVISAADVSIQLPNDLNTELFDGLLQELPIQVNSFTSAIEKLASGEGKMQDVEQAKRAAHTLKGAANTVGIAGIANLTHHLEDLLIALSNQHSLPDRALSEILTEAGDCLEAMGEAVMDAGPAPAQAQEVLQQVCDYVRMMHSGEHVAQRIAEDVVPEESQGLSAVMSVAQSEGVVLDLVEPGSHAAEPMLRVPAKVVDELLRLAGENVISNAQIQEQLKQTQKQSKAIQKHDIMFQKLIADLENLVDVRGMSSPQKIVSNNSSNSSNNSISDGDFDPLEFERYSELHTITAQLVEARTDAFEMSNHIDEQLHSLAELLEVQRRLQMENQHAVIRTRLVPVTTVVSRLQRSVRQTCRLLDKQVNLTILGANTNIDSNMLNDLTDPLMHILRNAVDHGIEALASRLAQQKPVAGLIELSFAREGNSIVVRCRDDGAGLDYAAIRRTALKRKLISADRILSDEELARLILMPGFSTRDASTQTSGRGIGMDMVHSRILEMKGSLNLRSVAGQGLVVELRLPASLLSEHTLMARVGGNMMAISSRRILDIHYITDAQIDMIANQPVYRVGDAVHQLLKLEDLLGVQGRNRDTQAHGYPVLLISTDTGATCAIQVQELVDGREVVVKKFGRYVPKIQGTIGAVILGDGSVAPVIDLPELLRATMQQDMHVEDEETGLPVNSQTQTQTQTNHVRTALVVDDSLSARRASAQIMRDAGYEVRTAIDGLEAVALIDEALPDVILVDMEMPRMNGLELTSHVRARKLKKHIPIIMITSRSTQKHRQQGDSAGVDAYLVKPFSEDALLQHINRLTGV